MVVEKGKGKVREMRDWERVRRNTVVAFTGLTMG